MLSKNVNICNKVDRCLARYSPRAKANNGTMQYHAIPCNTVRFNTIQCDTVQYNATSCNTMQYHAIPMQYHKIQCNTIRYNSIPCSIIRCHTNEIICILAQKCCFLARNHFFVASLKIKLHCIALYRIKSYGIAWYCIVPLLAWRAGCISQDTYFLYIIFLKKRSRSDILYV